MPLDHDAASNEYTEIGDVSALNITGSEISVECWVNIASKTAEKKVIAKWSDSAGAFSYLLSIAGATDDKPLFVVHAGGSNGVVEGTTALVVGTWYHIVGTYDGTTLRIYVNGVEENTTAKSGTINSTTAAVRIGIGSGTVPEQPMDGSIDNPGIYDRDLTAAEIEEKHALQGKDRIGEESLAGGWRMDEFAPGASASGADSVRDRNNNGNHGTPTNTPTGAEGILSFGRMVA